MTKKKRKKPTGATMGSILVGFDQQVFRTLPPAHELVVKSTPQRGLSGQDPELEIVFPDDARSDDRETEEKPPPQADP
jgi:hypothetical protein